MQSVFPDFLGLFKLESTSIFVRESFADVEAAANCLIRLHDEAVDPSFRGNRVAEALTRLILPNFWDGADPGLGAISAGLTDLHEQDHFKVLSSTPVGLLLWRIQQCIAVDVFYLRRRMPEVKIETFPTMLDAWNASARSEYEAGKADLSDPLYITAHGAVLLRTFLDVLLGREPLTIGKFLEIANAAFEYLAIRSGLSPKNHAQWTSDLDTRLPFLPDELPSLLEIIEASARARELSNLELARIKQDSIDSWRSRAIFGVYAPAFNALMAELGSGVWAKTAVDLTLSTPIDICCGTQTDCLQVEDVIPSYRFGRIISGLRREIWQFNLEKESVVDKLYRELPESVGLVAIRPLYEKLASAQLSFNANWGGRFVDPTTGAPAPEADFFYGGQKHLDFLEQQYKRNFLLRARDPLHFITTQHEIAHRPLLTFYSDQVSVCGEHLGGDIGLAFSAFVHFYHREVALEYAYGMRDSAIATYEKLFNQWCVKTGVEPDVVESVSNGRHFLIARPDLDWPAAELQEQHDDES